MIMTDLDRKEDRIAAPMQEILVQYYGEIIHVDIHVAAHIIKVVIGNIERGNVLLNIVAVTVNGQY